MIIDIRGSSGSGKTWIVRNLLDRFPSKPLKGDDPSRKRNPCLLGYEIPKLKAVVIGPYEHTANTGGCDSIKTPEEVCRRIRLFARQYKHVILEGLLVGKCFQRYADLADELGREQYAFCYLTTPSEVSLTRIHARRKKVGNNAPFNEKNFWVDYRAGVSARIKHTAQGYKVVLVDYTDPMPQILKLLGKRA